MKKFGNHITKIFRFQKNLSNRQTFMDRPDKLIIIVKTSKNIY